MPRVKTEAEKKPSERSADLVGDYLGICSTCNYAPDCAHRIKNAGVAIWECENYDDYVRLNGTFVGGDPDSAPAREKSRPVGDDPVLVELRGLCRNCAKREYCSFPRPESGVWHCEEYE
jgi:hypothetical protein